MSKEEDVDALVRTLGLAPHPEGGFYKETYRAALTLAKDALPGTFAGARAASTAIYYLLRRGDFSALHRIASDEVWHFYAGSALTVHCLSDEGEAHAIRLGARVHEGEAPQAVVRAGTWFGARVEAGAYALVGCTVSPGFDFADFEMGERAALVARFPAHRALIESLTRV